jgi:hypothetical protein
MNIITNTINSIVTWFYNEFIEPNNNLPGGGVMDEPVAFGEDVDEYEYDIYFDYFGDQLV